MYADLHLHSTASDGTDTPSELAALCREAGVRAFALTDHDTVAGLSEAAAAADRLGLDFVPGIEVSADPDLVDTGHRRGTLHILGLFVEADHPALLALTEGLRRARAERNPRIIENLNRLGIDITYEQVTDRAARSRPASDTAPVIGRPHIAQVLIDEGHVQSIEEAFKRYIGQDAPAYARADRLSAEAAIRAIHAGGGLAALAHPVQLQLDPATLKQAVRRLADLGLDAIETHHSDHPPAAAADYTALAQRFNLLTTGGSDYHGSRKSTPLNSQQLPLDMFHRLRDVWQSRRTV